MSAVMSRPFADYTSTDLRSIDELDAAICGLAKQMNIDSYRTLVLVREFDDRFGWMKWSFKTCAEWLAWRCSLMPSTARERVRTAHALRRLPAIRTGGSTRNARCLSSDENRERHSMRRR
jgi:hypothetical protein